jgi:hypothetical protein
MLSRILKELRNSGNVIDLDGLSKRLGVERSALDGMLVTLVRQGRLREVCTAGPSGGCHCGGSCRGCELCNSGGTIVKSYELVSSELPD